MNSRTAGRSAPSTDASTSVWTRRAAVWGPAGAIGLAGWLNRWNSDDAFITFRVVDQVLDGNGPVFNAGERVEAATSTLWLAVLTIGAVLPGDIEWFAVIAGLTGTVAGTALAGAASVRLTGPMTAPYWVPFGSIVFLALPPAWHFATSGLETGLTFAWLGGCFLALVRELDARGSQIGTAVLLGLGPLIRPDLAIFSAAFLGALVLLRHDRGRRWALTTLAAALALPLAYQVFRMGYYAALVPSTAIAKEASASRVDQGLRYLGDLASPYLLWLPLAAVAGMLTLTVRRWNSRSSRSLVALSPVVAGLAHAAFVVRVGGDFMHARLLLPGLFGVLLPLMVLPLQRGHRSATVSAVVVTAWGLLAAFTLRTDYHGTPSVLANGGIADEHGFYTSTSGTEHPVTVEDYRGISFVTAGTEIRRHLEQGRSYVNPDAALVLAGSDVAPRRGLPQPIVTAFGTVGLTGFVTGPRVWIVDVLGLADPFAARTALPLNRPGRIGHEKSLHPAWVLARFAQHPPTEQPEVAAAVRALRCGDVAELDRAVRDPLTPARFVHNLLVSPRLTSLRLAPEPTAVADDEC